MEIEDSKETAHQILAPMQGCKKDLPSGGWWLIAAINEDDLAKMMEK